MLASRLTDSSGENIMTITRDGLFFASNATSLEVVRCRCIIVCLNRPTNNSAQTNIQFAQGGSWADWKCPMVPAAYAKATQVFALLNPDALPACMCFLLHMLKSDALFCRVCYQAKEVWKTTPSTSKIMLGPS